MKKNPILAFILLFNLFLPNLSAASDTENVDTETTEADESTDKQDDDDLTLSGYIDGSYNYLHRSNQFTSGVNDRVFDLNENGFTLQQAAVTAAVQPKEGFGALVNVIAGRDAFTLSSYGMDPDIGIDDVGIDLTQAYFQYTTGSLTLIAGKFISLASAEVIDPTQDTNFSRSILFGYATPDTLTGFRATYVFNDKVYLFAGVNNGWDNIRDTSRDKTAELGVSYTLNPIFSFVVQGYSGQQRATDRVSTGPIGTRNMLDFVATINATDKLSFVTNYNYGMQTTAALPDGTDAEAIWEAIAGYVNYKFTEKWLTSFRGEIFDDKDGYRTGVAQVWKELTLSVGYLPTKNTEIRAETRRDFSNTNSFQDKNGVDTSNNQQSFAVEAFYKF
jgi:hypothetical protein